ncbi:hypothetical protein FPOAC2_01527 [Fusarium poae]|jgi:hypothetical protein
MTTTGRQRGQANEVMQMTMHSHPHTNKQSLQYVLSHEWYVRRMQPATGQGTKKETGYHREVQLSRKILISSQMQESESEICTYFEKQLPTYIDPISGVFPVLTKAGF